MTDGFPTADPAGWVNRMPIMKLLGVRPAADQVPGSYTAEMEVTAETVNLNGAAHGGAIATLIDHAGGYGARALTGTGGPTADLHVRYLKGAREGSVLRAEAQVLRAGRRIIVMEVKVTDDAGDLVAVGDLGVSVVERTTLDD